MEAPDRAIASRVSRVAVASSLVGCLAFLILAALVHLRALAGADEAAMQAKSALEGSSLDTLGALVSVLLSIELSLVYAAIGSVALWRAGFGRRSLVPFAFLLLLPLEFGLKSVVDQPTVPAEYRRGVSYPLTSASISVAEGSDPQSQDKSGTDRAEQDEPWMQLRVRNGSLGIRLDVTLEQPPAFVDLSGGTFPSGHAIRTGFLFTFAAVAASRCARGSRRTLALGLALLGATLALTRFYLGTHWASDVVAGLVLGASLALPLAAPVFGRLCGSTPTTSATSRSTRVP